MNRQLTNRILDMLLSKDPEMNEMAKIMLSESIDSYVEYQQWKRIFQYTVVRLSTRFGDICVRMASVYDINAILFSRMRRKYEID